METSEVQELLEKMGVFNAQTSETVNSAALMVDPIVSNKLAVELLQQVDRDAKPEIVLSLPGIDSYFAYNVALSAWMKFGICEPLEDTLQSSVGLKKKDKVVIVLDTFDEQTAQKFIDFVESHEAKVVAILSLVGKSSTLGKIPCHCLVSL